MSGNSIRKRELQRKVLCSLLAAGVMSVCISGGDVWAAGTIKDKDTTITNNMNIIADDGNFEGTNNRYAAIGNTQAETMTVTAASGVVVSSSVTTTNGRAMGIVNTGNGILNVNGSYIFDLEADTVRGIRNNGYNDLNLNGDFTIKAVSKSTNAANDVVVGVEAFNGTNITVNGDKLDIDITTDNARIIGVQNFANNGNVITFNSKDMSIKAVQTGEGSYCQGVLGYQSTTNFNGNVVIDLKANQVSSQVHGVDIQCDPGNAYETVVKFNNQNTDIKVEGGSTATVAAIRASGVPGIVSLNGTVTNLTATNIDDGLAAAIISQYGAHVKSGADTNVNAIVNSKNGDAVAIYISEYAGYNGNVELKGNLTADVISENGDAYGVMGELSDDVKSENDGKIYIGKNLDLDVQASNGNAIGIGAVGKYNKTVIDGDTTITAVGKTAATALSAKDSGQIIVGSAGKTVTLTAGSTGGKVIGINATGGSDVTVNGEKLVLDLNSNVTNGTVDDRIIGIDGSANEGGKITINSAETLLTGVQEGSTVYSDGVRANMSTIDFNGNVTIDLKGDLKDNGKQSQFAGVNVQCDPGDNWDTAVNFNGTKTGIKVAGQSSWLAAVQGSGVPGSINFTGEKVDLTAINTGSGEAVGIYSQYGATIKSDAVTNINATIQANSSAKGIYNTNNYGYNGNVKLNGSFTGTVTSNAENAHGIYNDPLAEDSTGGSVLIGKNLQLQVTAANGEAIGIYGEGKYSNTTVLGNTTIIAAGKTAATALSAKNGGKITVGSAGKTVSLTGDVVSESNGVITLAGDTNTVKGIVTADGGSVVLNGGGKATYAVDKFVTANSGKIIVSGGTLNIDDLNKANSKFALDSENGNSLEVTGKGVLKAKSENVFGKDADNKTIVSGTVDEKVLFNGGKLAISDDSYKLADSKAYSTALAAAESNAAKTTLVMTGTLQQEDIPDNTAGVEDLAPTGAVHTQVTGTVESDTLNIGGAGTGSPDTGTSVNNDLGVKDLDFSGSSSGSVESAKVNISNDTGLTLVGDGSGDLLKGTNSSGNKVTVGSTDSSGKGTAGTLTLGNTASVNSGGNLNAAVELGHNDSQMNVEAGSFKVDKITATAGTVAVNEGAALKTAELTIGTATGNNDTEGTVKAAGTVEVDKLTVNKGTVAVTGSLKANALTASSDTSIAVGDSTSAGTLTATGVQLQGGSIVLDPAWRDGNTIATASKAGLEFANSHQIDGKLTVGQNSVLSLGTTDTSKAEAAFAATGLTWGKNDITAALYIDAAQTLDNSNGGIKVDGTLTHDSEAKDLAVANNAEFADKSLLMVSSAAAAATDGALKATNSGKLTVDAGAKLYIADAQAGQTYTVVSGFGGTGSSVEDNGWTGENLLLNKLVKATASGFADGSFTVTTKKVKASEALPGVALPNILDAMTSDTNSEYAGVKYLSNAISGLNTDAQTIASVNAFAQGAENSGASHSSVLAAFDTGSIVQGHLSLANKNNELSGGFGKAAADREDNGGIWAQYIHNKDKSDAGYEGQYNGFVLGGDFADKGKYSSGVAFSYGSGDSTGSASKNEYDFWGLSYYGGIRNDDTNLIFDVGYSKNSSEIKGVVNADPDTRIITLGVKGEKMYTNGHGTKFVPYAGLRYMNVDTDSYTGTIDGKTAAHYSPDKADLWLLPVGVSITNETVSESGWKVRPTADIAYVWTMGDNDNAMGITVPGINAQDRLGYELMDSGFFVGRLGLEAEKDDWTYGVSYSYQKGSDAQSNKWFVDVKYSF